MVNLKELDIWDGTFYSTESTREGGLYWKYEFYFPELAPMYLMPTVVESRLEIGFFCAVFKF